VAKYNVTVNAIAPASPRRDMLAKSGARRREQILTKIPMGRFGKPEDIAARRRVPLLRRRLHHRTAINVQRRRLHVKRAGADDERGKQGVRSDQVDPRSA